ncbi:MAG: hypothetical protein Q8K00_18575 [Syntrophales bacterium]|nr:hypothetical protein [Syntrophales bacterium]
MERRRFIELSIAALAAGALSAVVGCSRTEAVPALTNQEKLWKMTAAAEKMNEPVDLAYLKNTSAFYRDASFGKEDPNFKPKTGGG